MVAAVVFDLDDTLICQQDWLERAAARVARASSDLVDEQVMYRAMLDVLAQGSAQGNVIDKALKRAGAQDDERVGELVEVFMSTRVPGLASAAGAQELLGWLNQAGVRTGILTDGRSATQRGKIMDANLRVDEIVVSDELGGRQLRKPHPAGLQTMAARLGVSDMGTIIVVGDRPDKDAAVAVRCGARAWRVRSGEWAGLADWEGTEVSVGSLVDIGTRLRAAVG